MALLRETLADEPAALARDGGVIRDGFDAELDELRALDAGCGDFLTTLEARERERTGIASLRVGFNQVHGFYIEVGRGSADRVPDDYRRRQTLKNAERFITPELKQFEDRALSARERALARERYLYEELVAALKPSVAAWQALGRAVAEIDVLATLAARAAQMGWVRPRFSPLPGIEIRGARHPVVEAHVERYVPNDCVMHPQRRLLILTGPNMGGKSTYMRSVALIALLACCGSFVPADACTLGPIDRIFTRIGASDDLAQASGRADEPHNHHGGGRRQIVGERLRQPLPEALPGGARWVRGRIRPPTGGGLSRAPFPVGVDPREGAPCCAPDTRAERPVGAAPALAAVPPHRPPGLERS